MTIIDTNHYLEQLLSPTNLDRIARDCQFCLRKRTITPLMLVTALLRGLGCDKVNAIAGLHEHFNGLQLAKPHQVAYKPFHNQLRKPAFALFMKTLVERAAERVMRLYRCRWQVELLFKVWKSHNRLKGFVTGQKAIAEGLVWASLLSLVMKRRVGKVRTSP